jgi:hypothetical protein
MIKNDDDDDDNNDNKVRFYPIIGREGLLGRVEV